MTEPIHSPPNPPAKNTRRLPSLRVRCALAACLFALGIAVGAAIGPAPQESLAGGAVNPRALIASLLARNAAAGHAPAGTPAPHRTETKPASKTSPPASAAAAATPPIEGAASTPAPAPAAKTPTTGASGTSAPASPTTGLPAIGHVWLILLPGEGMASATAQPSSDPYLAKQLVPAGTLLSSYSSLTANALVSSAALLSGKSTPQATVLSAPGCTAASEPTCTPGSAAELASVDAWLHAQIPPILASADYTQGLVAIAFTAAPGGDAPTTTTTTGAPTTPAGAAATPAPATLATQPVGVLLLSPFLRRPGGRSSTNFNPANPRKVLEGLLRP